MHAVQLPQMPSEVAAVAAEFGQKWLARAVLWVGPRARALSTPDSDYDIALILPHGCTEWFLDLEQPTRIGIEAYPMEALQALVAEPTLPPQELRVARRLANAQVLTSSLRSDVRAMINCLAESLLAPDAARDLLESASINVAAAEQALVCKRQRLWFLHGGVSALAMLALQLSDIGFNKPKWVAHDLRYTGHDDIRQALFASLVLDARDDIDAGRVNSITSRIEGWVNSCFRDSINERAKAFITFTLKGARGLLSIGDVLGAMHTAVTAARVFYSELLDALPSDRWGEAATWQGQLLEDILPENLLSRANIAKLSADVRRIGARLQSQYQRQYQSRAGCSNLAHSCTL